MHEVFKIKSSKTNPKFQQYFINFEKPQNFQKPQILGFKTWNACKWKRLETYREKKNLEKNLKNHKGKGLEWERECVWEMNRCGQIERDRRNENRIAKNVYIDP